MKKILYFLLLIATPLQLLADNLSRSNALFDCIEYALPKYFSPAESKTTDYTECLFRFYSNTNTHIWTRGEAVYASGDIWGDLTYIGEMSDFTQSCIELSLQFHGIYQSEKINDQYWTYLRFYEKDEEGKKNILITSTTGSPEQINNWFNTEDHENKNFSKLTYNAYGAQIKFSEDTNTCYEVTSADNDTLTLTTYKQTQGDNNTCDTTIVNSRSFTFFAQTESQ
ncbi:MAG: hypothetical protein methR_P2536 [Methyloprofundus sp.]|nr:MAG: hypothetical protein methR_P2536 [Methyloprofundus sp.]